MATRTKPLISAAALASAAAVAVVSPGVAPSLNLPTPSALSRAAYELTTFTDVLSVPGQVWTNVLFGNPIGGNPNDPVAWGYALGIENYGPDWAEPQSQFGQYGYVNPWAAYCNYTCAQSGLTGAAYLFFDALINGEGTGYENSDNWKVGLVNYFFEPNSVFQLGGGSSPSLQFVSQGFSAASWYLLQGTIGQITPQVSVPLATAFWGPYSASVFFNFAAQIVAGLLAPIPVVGPLLGNTLLAYLGDLFVEPGTDIYYQYGLSGPLNYLIDLANGSVPWPTKVPWYKIDPATAATVPAAAPAATEVEAESNDVVAAEGTETEVESSASVSEASETESESHGSDASETEASEAKIEAVESEAVETETETETEAVATEFAESTPEVEAPKAETTVEVTAAELAESAPVVAAPKRPRPVRDAVENVGKQISTAVANAKAAKAERVEARKAKAKAKAGAASAE